MFSDKRAIFVLEIYTGIPNRNIVKAAKEFVLNKIFSSLFHVFKMGCIC